MTAARAQRGRPKGTGINDQHRLAEIARLMAADPRLKPTTAIKALGITDPSTIRRLRDKFNGPAMAPSSTGSNISPSPCPAGTPPSSPRIAALKHSEPVKRLEAKPAANTNAAPGPMTETSVKSATPQTIPVAALLFGFGLNAATAIFEQQMMIAQSVMKLPQVRDLVRHQIAFTEFMLNVANASPGSRVVH